MFMLDNMVKLKNVEHLKQMLNFFPKCSFIVECVVIGCTYVHGGFC